MRRFSRDREHKEGYEWLRFQESKLLTFLSLLSLLSLFLPLLFDIKLSLPTYIIHVTLSLIILHYSLTTVHIVAEDDGIYIEINKSKHTKIQGWEDSTVFLSTKPNGKRVLAREAIYAISEDKQKKLIYEAHCHKVCPFIRSICSELSEIHERRKASN